MDYSQDGQACRQTFIYRITEGLPVTRAEPCGQPKTKARVLLSGQQV
jgi:hypothetical protein